ncbi:hypothetical protein PAXRUDRAFT_155713 [Paxillus rubicundulus Ve08.2h10]|uniref:Uncharacterized protein n=1 Tax=Paxillus rubicundulus Ve08.2h10 TaxID=930991 RepID=A0A0D0CFT9_9AGAM|nr:hypothetical protein PAXRUDRAFT_155713 [Paxillus rubicundulus Ve08.2h10]
MSMEQASSVLCPPNSLWVLTDLIMDYMCHRFHAEMEMLPTTHPMTILPDINIPAEMVFEVDRMANILVRAHKNPEPAILIIESGEVITWYLLAASLIMWESLEKIKMSLPHSIGRNRDTVKIGFLQAVQSCWRSGAYFGFNLCVVPLSEFSLVFTEGKSGRVEQWWGDGGTE